MDEPKTPQPTASSPARSGLWRWLLFLVLLAALGYGGWRVWQRLESTTDTLEAEDALIRRLSQQLRALETDNVQLERHLADTDGTVQRNATEVDTLKAQQASALKSIEVLDATLKGGRARFQLAAVEELLLLAHDRVALSKDVASAVIALELADARLAALADARLLPIREALSVERLALLSASKPDLTGAALTLGGLLDRAASLPLRARVPNHFDPVSPAGSEEPELPASAEWPARLWAGVRSALGAVFRIQRETRPVDRLLPPEQEALIHTLLTLKLEGARLALLRQEALSYRDLLDGALRWLDQYYVPGDARVLATRAELERLRAMDLSPALPLPTKALERLRALNPTGSR